MYFKAKWDKGFFKENTSPGTFHAPDGDVENAFMRQRIRQTYFWGDKFAAVYQFFVEGGSMWFILPDEGIAPEELLTDIEVMEFLFTADRNEWKNQRYLLVNKSIPKLIKCRRLFPSERVGLRRSRTEIWNP